MSQSPQTSSLKRKGDSEINEPSAKRQAVPNVQAMLPPPVDPNHLSVPVRRGEVFQPTRSIHQLLRDRDTEDGLSFYNIMRYAWPAYCGEEPDYPGFKGKGTAKAIILKDADEARGTPAVVLTPASKKSTPTMHQDTWKAFGCKEWKCANVHITMRVRTCKKTHVRSSECRRCVKAAKRNELWAGKMGLIPAEAGDEEMKEGEEGEEPKAADAGGEEGMVC